MMNMFLVNTDNKAAKSLIKKLCNKKQDGEIIGLTTEEMDLYNSIDFRHVYTSDSQSMFIELEPQKKYIAVVNEDDVSVQDILDASHMLDLDIAIVRINK